MTTSVTGPDGGGAGAADRRSARDLLGQHPVAVAPRLLGAHLSSLVDGLVVVRITEVEAYGGLGEDPASHANRRRTDRNAAMFGPVGHAYVYFTYGMHWCLNVVAHEPGVAGAVLLRAGQVVDGLELAHARRPAARSDRDLARGPARLAAALGMTGALDGTDLLDDDGPLRLSLEGGADGDRHAIGPRIGVAEAGADTPWRFWIEGDPTVTPYRPTTSRRRASR